MKTIALTVIAAGMGFAQSSTTPKSTTAAKPAASTAQKSKSQAPRKATAAQKANPPVTIPEGAKQVEPNLYRYTDSNGKTWMYRQSPFGISKYEDVPAASTPRAVASEPVAVTDLGDSVRFEKKTAFGESQWVRKKTELTDDEKALVASQQDTKQAPASNAKTPEKQ